MGKIELDHTGSGSGITLSSDGTDLLLDGTAIGGGGSALELYAENPSTPTAPSATGNNAVAIGSNARASTSGSIAIGPSANILSGSGFNIAIGYNATMSDSYGAAIGYNSSATGNGSLAIGHTSRASGTYATAITRANASGQDSFAAAISTNSTSYGASGTNGIAIGKNAKATSHQSVCISNTSTASAQNAVVIGGSSGTASANSSVVLGGSSNTASGLYSTAKGYYGNTNGIRLKHSTGLYPNMQGAYYVLGYTTSDATPIALNTSVWTPDATNQIVLSNNSALSFHGTVIARQQAADGTACAAWKVEGLIRREGSASTTTLVNSATTVLDNTPSWGLALSADTTNGCLKVQATGAAATDIRWVATIHTSEVTYA